MQNRNFDTAVSRLAIHFGTARPLESGSGVRFTSVRRGKISVYHANLAAGNQVEIAFEPVTVARRMQVGERELRSLISDLRSTTGRDVSPVPQFDWPRVGVSEARHVDAVMEALEKVLHAAR